MTRQHKPAGYNSVSPYLVTTDAAATIEFLKRTFGATELRKYRGDAGKLMHAEVRIDDSVVMLADGAPPEWPAIPAHVHVYVPDVDATFRKALEAGGTPVQEPVQKEDEDKRGGVLDPGGITWWIGTRVG